VTEMVLAVLLVLALLAMGGALLDAVAARRKALRARLQDWDSGSTVPGALAAEQPVAGFLARIGGLLLPGGPSRTLEDELARAGFYGKAAPGIFIASKVVVMIVGLAVCGSLVAATEMPLTSKALAAVLAGAILFFLPNGIARWLRARRRQQVWQQLPYAIDLMEVCVSSGMGLDQAWNVVAEELGQGKSPLADEMALTTLEIHLGATRLEATRHMAERTGVDEVSSFATMLVQSERFGTSIADALQAYAGAMREERSLRAQEAAEKAAVKLIIPMATLLIPALLIVILGPGLMLVVNALEMH